MQAPELNAVWTFIPSAFEEHKDAKKTPYRVMGRVIDVNTEHRHFTVRTTVFGHTFCESFKF